MSKRAHLTKEQNEALRVKLNEYIKIHNVTYKKIAEIVGRSTAMIQSFCVGRFGVSSSTAFGIELMLKTTPNTKRVTSKKMARTRVAKPSINLDELKSDLATMAAKITTMQKLIDTLSPSKEDKPAKVKLDYEPLPKSKHKELVQQNRARARLGVKLINTKIVECLSCHGKFETTGNRMCKTCGKETDYAVQMQGPIHY
jgi:hypothetical protein